MVKKTKKISFLFFIVMLYLYCSKVGEKMYNDYSDYTTYTTGYDGTGSGLFASLGIGIWLFGLILSIIMIISMWKIYKKAGKPGWASIIPIYNIIVLLEIVELPMWYIALLILPFANIYATFKIFIELAQKFGKSTGFGVLTVFFSIICLPIIAFGKDKYSNSNTNADIPNIESNSEMPKTFSSEQNNNDNINDINNLNSLNNKTANSNSMDATGFVPVGNLNNNIQSLSNNENNEKIQEPNIGQNVINIPASPIPNVEPVMPSTSENNKVQTLSNDIREAEIQNDYIVNNLNNINVIPITNDNIEKESIPSVDIPENNDNLINNSVANNQTIFTNMNNNDINNNNN